MSMPTLWCSKLSSFQLDTASTFRPDIGVLLNVTEDHLDRYESFKAYTDSKLSIFRRQNSADFAIINGDDPICSKRIEEIPGKVLSFSSSDSAANARVEGRAIKVAVPGKGNCEIGLEKTRLPGSHNRENIMAAALAAMCMEVCARAIQAAVDGFGGFAHRVEWVRNWKGIDFYDDSKGTNVGAVVKALEGFDRPVMLLLGGRDKLGSLRTVARAAPCQGQGDFRLWGSRSENLWPITREGPGRNLSGFGLGLPGCGQPGLAGRHCPALYPRAPLSTSMRATRTGGIILKSWWRSLGIR